LFALATVATFTNRPIMTLAESTATTTAGGPGSEEGKNGTTGRGVQRLLLLPQDIYYDTKVQEALQSIRDTKRVDYDDNQNNSNNKESTKAVTTVPPILASSGTTSMATLTLIGYKGGALDAQINQDRAFCLEGFFPTSSSSTSSDTTPNKLVGVFDGHAKYGERVSQYAVEEIAPRLEHKLRVAMGMKPESSSSSTDDDDEPTTATTDTANPQEYALEDDGIVAALSETFVELDRTAPAHMGGGCTATVVLHYQNKLYIANAGDSQSFVVVYRSKSQQVEILYQTREDKPSLPDERARVEAAGGVVYIPMRAGGTSRVLYEDPVTGHQSGLAMSRSIGDWDAGKLGVIPDPLVEVVDVEKVLEERLGSTSSSSWGSSSSTDDNENDDIHIFAVSATDGMMDYVDSSTIAVTLAESLFGPDGTHPLTACEKLITLAANGWQRAKQGRYRDDIAIAVSKIREPPVSRSAEAAASSPSDDEL